MVVPKIAAPTGFVVRTKQTRILPLAEGTKVMVPPVTALCDTSNCYAICANPLYVFRSHDA
jgi:hypothetical protein